ncbi:hypothetical protein BGZ98_007837 [Dissophora globulifera]|nr:hypothetical protein BGZ98_007837 [Dissophora globulifera]
MACSFRTQSFRSSLFADGPASPCLHLAARHVRSPPTLNCSARASHGLRLVSSQSKARSSDQLEVFREGTSWHSNHPSINDCRRWSSISGDGGSDQSARSKQSLQGTFVTGGKWDTPTHSSTATGLSSSGSPWVPPSSTTTATTTSAWDSLKQQISSDLSDDESSQSNIQANLKKLDAISKVTKRKQAYSPFMLITQLPSTVMPDDIKRMASSEGSIKDIIYHRNQYMEFQNRATVVFRSATDAVEFITQKYGKFLGTHKLNMTLVTMTD